MSVENGVIWQGFHHTWRYNHRLNRLGSYLQRTDETDEGWKTVHTGASGSGPDTVQFCDLYTHIAAGPVAFQPTEEPFELNGDEAAPISKSKTVSVTPDSELQDAEEYAVVLNGFDLVSNPETDADKLMSLSVSVDQPSDTSGDIAFDVSVSFEADCGSGECRDPGVDYTCYLFFLLIGGPQDRFRLGPATTASTSYDWDLSVEPDRKASGQNFDTLDSAELWTEDAVDHTVGITELSVDLTKTDEPDTSAVVGKIYDLVSDFELQPHAKAMHLLELDFSVENVRLKNEELQVEYLTFYSNWTEGMKQYIPDDFLQDTPNLLSPDVKSTIEDESAGFSIHDVVDASVWAHRNGGEAALELSGRVLQFADTDEFDQNVVPGSIEWPGKNTPATENENALYDRYTDTSTDKPGDARSETMIL